MRAALRALLALLLCAALPAARGGRLLGWLHGARAEPVARDAASSWVHARANASGAPLEHAQLMMHRAEADLVAAYLRPGDVLLEWGSGGSTRNFPPLVKRAYSIEHNCEWLEYLRRELLASGRDYRNLETKCVRVTPGTRGWGTVSAYEHANYEQFKEYVDAVDRFPDKRFDRVFIDGRARMACALKVLPHLKHDSLVFIHDFFTRTAHYAGVMDYYIEVARVLAFRNTDPWQGPVDEPQGLVVLRPRANLTLPLSDAQINAAYERIDWRYPFPPPLTSLGAILHYYLIRPLDTATWARARSPDHLIRLVRSDLLSLALLYGVTRFLMRNSHLLLPARPSRTRQPLARAASVPARAQARVLVGGAAEPASRTRPRMSAPGGRDGEP